MDINGDETDTKKITCSTIDNRQALICQSEMCFSFNFIFVYVRLKMLRFIELVIVYMDLRKYDRKINI